jgi:hypothetical protein
VADERGPFNALGTTLFWAAWGFRSDRARLERNLQALSDAGFDYVRVLGSVGGESWEDRPVDPRWGDYDAVVQGVTDLIYDRYGMRTQWTVFGGAPFTPSGEPREVLVDRFAKLAKGREHKIFAFEIANEARYNGFEGPDGMAELRRLGKRLNDQTSVLVALTAPAEKEACDTYAGAGADAATVHYVRTSGSAESWSPVLQPWTYPGDFDDGCRGQLPPVAFNNEPIGPESSVEEDDDVERIAGAYVLTFLANNAAYVLHTGPGVRGGGDADRKRGRHANIDELPSFRRISRTLGVTREYLPPGLANWTRHEPNSPKAPLTGSSRIYAASKGTDFVALVVPGPAAETFRTARASRIDVREAATGRVIRQVETGAGGEFRLSPRRALVLVGQRKR